MKALVKPAQQNDNAVIHKLEMEVCYDERKDIMAKKVTLNGNPATISGGMTRFAVVRQLNGDERYEWSWETVKNIVNNKGGKFLS